MEQMKTALRTDEVAEVVLELDATPGDGVLVTVADTGGWRAPAPDDEPGHGLALMEALMSSVRVDTGENGTVVRLTRE